MAFIVKVHYSELKFMHKDLSLMLMSELCCTRR